ncbi:MAG: ABC transporter permease, partial [Chloroflexota bacterium]
ALLLLAAWNTAARSRRRTEREESGPTRIAARRLVLDAVVIGMALTSVWLLRERGLSGGESLGGGSSAGGQVAGSDPFLALSPVLIGIAVGLLTLRIYPLPVRALGALAARRRDLVPVLALREVSRRPAASYLPLLILTVTMALGSFASVIQVTIERGQVAASWLNIGADYVVSAIGDVPLAPSVDPASLDGVVAAVGHREAPAQFIPDPVLVGRATLLAIDPTAYQAVLRDDPRPVQFPSAMAGAVPAGDVGSTDLPIPAILSARLATSPVELAVGDEFDLAVRNQRLTFRVVAIAEEFPGMGTRTDFVIAPFDWVAGAFVPGAIQPTTYFVRGGPDLADALQTRVEEQSVSAVIASRYVAYGALHDAPLVAAVSGGFLLSLVVAAVYAALAVVAAVILDAQRRSREIGQLRTLGATDRQVTGLTLIQHGLPTLVALLIGTALGVGVAWLVEPGLRLAAFIGPGARVRLEINPDSIAVVDVLVVGAVAAAVAASTVLAQRLDLGRILRIGEE